MFNKAMPNIAEANCTS
uniref:Uncharacterized protein n=1 Tax=Arundo donax TaxID=35708 RepID=A0A0A8Y3R9_ARUDO